jgi:hypothetical protein
MVESTSRGLPLALKLQPGSAKARYCGYSELPCRRVPPFDDTTSGKTTMLLLQLAVLRTLVPSTESGTRPVLRLQRFGLQPSKQGRAFGQELGLRSLSWGLIGVSLLTGSGSLAAKAAGSPKSAPSPAPNFTYQYGGQ